MKRIILMVIKNILFAPWWCIQLCLYGREKDKHTEEERFGLLRKITINANKGGRVKIVTTGEDNLPKEPGFIFFPNHQGLYDVLSIIESSPYSFSVVMKKEVEHIPFLKQVFAVIKAKAIDREDIRQSMKVISEVTKEVQEGRNYVIFAEGTRSKQGNQVLDFKGGSFKAAMKAKCPIVPVALIDSFMPFDTNSIKSVTVQVHFLPPMYHEEYQHMKSTEIAALVKERIQKKIEENEKMHVNHF